jgi:hypothetical protein
MERLRPSGRSGEAGFTLIELMAPGLFYATDTACAAPGSTSVTGTSW